VREGPCGKDYRPTVYSYGCCFMRINRSYCVMPDGRIFPAQHAATSPGHAIGHISSYTFDSLHANSAELIRRSNPVFNDPNCRSCDLIGFCWGGCISNYVHHRELKPSTWCNKSAIRHWIIENRDDIFGGHFSPATGCNPGSLAIWSRKRKSSKKI
jgi:radical SAM protein with 4Fe4S-binding SPASM domain